MTSATRSPLRLLCFAHSAGLRGAERSLADLVAGLVRRGLECHVMLPEEGPLCGLMEARGARAHVAASRLVGRHWSWAVGPGINDAVTAEFEDLVVEQARALAPDFVLSQTIVSPWGAMCAESLSRPHLTSIREYGRLDHGLPFALGLEACVAALAASSAQVFCISHDVRSVLFRGADQENVEVIYSHIEADGGPAAGRPRAAERPVIGILGALCPGKGQHELVRACIVLARQGIDFRCDLLGDAGDAAYVEALRAEIAAAGLEDVVRLRPFVEHPESEMAAMAAVISCARREAMGRTLIEASLLKVPVIYAAAGGPTEVFENPLHALSYPPGDVAALAEAIRRTLADPVSAAARAERAALRCAEFFSEERYCGTVYRRLLALPRDRPRPGVAPVWDLVTARFPRITAQVFMATEGAFSEAASRRVEFTSGRRHSLRFDGLSTPDETVRLRFDPLDRCGHLEILSLTLVRPIPAAQSAEQRERISSSAATLDGFAVVAEGGDWPVLFALNDDPRIELAPFPRPERGECFLEAELRVVTDGGAAADAVSGLSSALHEAKETLAAERNAHHEVTVALRDERLVLARRDAELVAERNAHREVAEALQNERRVLARRDAELAALAAEGRRLDAAAAALQIRLDDATRSLSWKLTDPLRSLERLFFRGPSRAIRSKRATCSFNLEADLGEAGLRRLENPVRLTGWFFDAAGRPARLVIARIGGRVVPFHGVDRPDVVAHFFGQGRELDDPRVGFSLELKTGPGLKHIVIEALCQDGAVVPLQGRLRWMASYRPPHEKLAWPGDEDPLPAEPDTAPAPAPELRAIAFYLPQFHAIPENDRWWGPGFTEWTNVRPARPQFESHYQPHAPHADLGHYDLNDAEVLEKQARMARAAGVYGFCYYYYWFGGKRLLEMPLERLLATGRPEMPFCYCWANENWSRRWDGLETEVLIAQKHSPEDDDAVIRDLMRAFRDPRYIRVHHRPLLLVYRPALIPDAVATFARWRELCRTEGVGEIHLAGVKGHGCTDADAFGLDALVEFPPNDSGAALLSAPPARLAPDFAGKLYDYREVRHLCLQSAPSGRPLYRGVTPSWDNTARRKNKGSIFVNSSPGAYLNWLRKTAAITRSEPDSENRLLFINAWNEWAEGCHLEPDEKHGHAWLNATRRALGSWPAATGATGMPQQSRFHPVRLPAAPDLVVAALFYYREDLIWSWLETLQPQAAAYVREVRGRCRLVLVLNYPAPAGIAEEIQRRFLAGPCPEGLSLSVEQPGFNQGFGAGHNAAFARHPGDVYVMMNSDLSVPRVRWLVDAVAHMRDTGCAIVGPASSAAKLRADGCGVGIADPQSEGFDFSDGSLLLVHSPSARELGLFGDGYRYFYFEDADLCLRYRQAGARIGLIDLPHDHARSSSTLTLPRALVQGVLDHNRARFFEAWGAYLREGTLRNELALVFAHLDLGQQLAALPAVFGLLRDHPTARLRIGGAHPWFLRLVKHPRIDPCPEEALGPQSRYHRHHRLDRLDESEDGAWPERIARLLGVDAAYSELRQHLVAPLPRDDRDDSQVCLLLKAPDPLLAGADLPWQALGPLLEEAHVLFDGPAYARPAAAPQAEILEKMEPARLIERLHAAALFVGPVHWTAQLAQLLGRPVFLWTGSLPANGALWSAQTGGLFRPPGLDCLGCRAALGTPHELQCIRGDTACTAGTHAAAFLDQLSSFKLKIRSVPATDLAPTRHPLTLRRQATMQAGMLDRWAESLVDDVLVLIPHAPAAPAARVAKARQLAERALAGMRRSRVVLDSSGEAPPRGAHALRQAALAAIRQGMVTRHLRDEKWVFWVDDDIVDYPADLVRELVRRADGGIAAPVVLMEDGANPKAGVNLQGFGPGRFFDVAGFVEAGRWARFTPPWFDQPGPCVDLESVGSCYLVPAELYRRGARHEVDPRSARFLETAQTWPADAVARGQTGEALAYTEHYSVCAFARTQGLPVRAFTDLVARHQRV